MEAVLESLPSSSNCTCATLPGRQIFGVVAGNDDSQQGRARVHGLFDRAVIVHLVDDLEIARAAEILDQRVAHRCPVQVVDHGRNMVHIQAERVAEHQQHHQRQPQRGDQAARVAQDVQESPCAPWRACGGSSCGGRLLFLDQADEDVFHRGRNGLQSHRCGFRRLPARRGSESRPALAFSTFTCRPPPNTATSRIPGRPSSAVMLPSRSDDSRFSRCPSPSDASTPRASPARSPCRRT